MQLTELVTGSVSPQLPPSIQHTFHPIPLITTNQINASNFYVFFTYTLHTRFISACWVHETTLQRVHHIHHVFVNVICHSIAISIKYNNVSLVAFRNILLASTKLQVSETTIYKCTVTIYSNYLWAYLCQSKNTFSLSSSSLLHHSASFTLSWFSKYAISSLSSVFSIIKIDLSSLHSSSVLRNNLSSSSST